VCITEHHDYDISEPFDAISRKEKFPIIRGMEYKAKEGHLLVYGVNMGRGDMPAQMPMQQVIDWVMQKGGVAIPAHPYQPDMFGACLGDRLCELKHLVAVEACNGSASETENQQAFNRAKKMGWGCVGGSDAHGPDHIGKAYTLFPGEVKTVQQLVRALKTKDYHPGSERR